MLLLAVCLAVTYIPGLTPDSALHLINAGIFAVGFTAALIGLVSGFTVYTETKKKEGIKTDTEIQSNTTLSKWGDN